MTIDDELVPTEAPAEPADEMVAQMAKTVAKLESAVETLDQHLKDSADMYQYLNDLIHKNREYLARVAQIAQKALDKTLILLPEPEHCRFCGKKVGNLDKVCGGCGRNPNA